MLPRNGPLVLEAEFDGVYYNHTWVYHPSDPLGSNATSIIGADGVEGDLLNERLVISPTSSPILAGYYIPRIYINEEGTILQNGVVLVRYSENTTAILAGDSSVTSGDDVVLTCTGTGYPQVTVEWKTSGLSEFSSVSVDDETIVSNATPRTPFIVTRTISLRSVTVRDCGEVTCIAHTIVSMVQNTTRIEVDGPPILTTFPKDVVKDVGDNVVIHCRAYICYSDTYQFDWYHNGELLTEPKVHNEENSSYLDLESLKEEEFGYYTCVLVHHNTSSTSYVSQRNSIVLHDELSQPPTSVLRANLTTPNLFNVKEGSSFSLTCTFEGVNDFSLVAYKNGKELFSTSELRLYLVQMSLSSPARRSKTLVVNFTKFSDSTNAGSYECRAVSPSQVLESRNISLLSANFCPSEIDEVWNIPWSDTLYGGTDVQNCSGDEGSGLATRKCSNGIWQDPDVNDCESAIFGDVRIKNGRLRENLKNALFYNGTGLPIREEDLEVIADITDTLVSNVNPMARTSPLFPKDLNTTNIFLDTVSLFADKTDLFAQPIYTEMDLLLIADYILDSLYENEWMTLIEDEYSGGSPLLLTSVEMISLVLARELGSNNQTTTDSDNGMMYVTYQGERINIRSFQVSPLGNTGKEMYTTVIYPIEKTTGTPQVCLPGEILAERAEGGNGSVLVVAGVVMNFTNILPRRFNNTSPIGGREPSPYLVIAQVSGEENKDSAKFDNSIVKMTFETQAPYCNADCVSWDPGMDSNSTLLQSSGGWSTEGLSEGDTDSDREVLCSSTHLTSFTILVDYTPGVDQNLEFTIVSYIGCGISLICLLLSLIFFLCQKKQIIENSVFFVHTNLCLALICGLILFFFIEEGGRQRIEAACSIVTFLIQYAFLSAFFWMLCEGIMMYILLVRVFGAHDKKWRLLFLIIGWGTPLMPAIVTIAVAYGTDKNYFIKTTRCQWLCWLSQKEYFIWAFITPMILLILINLVLGIRIMVALINFKRKHIKRTNVQKKNQELLRYSFKSFFFLLPLLGLTWLFGLLAANKLGGETQVFAWLFVICNTLQGCAFFFFHVVRHDKVWNKLEKTYCCKRWKEFSKKSMEDTNETDRTIHSVPETPLKSNVIFNTTTETDIVLDASIVHTNGKAEVMDESTDSNKEESATL